MRTITGTTGVYSYKGWYTPQSLLADKPDHALGSVQYRVEASFENDPDWVRICSAEITVTFDDDKNITDSIIKSLKAERQKLQADTQAALNKIDERIQSLLALPAPV